MAAPGEGPPGSVTARSSDGALVITLSGEIDACLRPELAALAHLAAGYDGRVVVDVADVRFGDGTLARFLAEARGQEPVAVRGPSRLVRDLLSVYGVRSAVRVVERE